MTLPTPGKYDEDAPAYKIMMLWGTLSSFSRAVGKTPSTVARWLTAGTIDGKYHAVIAEAAKRDKKKLPPEMFVDKRVFAK